MTNYLLPEDFRVYVSDEGGVVNWATPGYTEKILPTVNKYMLRDGGYIACYSRNEEGSIVI
jgi:cellobiose phosphorylase